MSDEKQREQSSSQEQQQLSVSPVEVLLAATDLAVARGAFRMQEMTLISQAYAMITQKETNVPESEKESEEKQQQPRQMSDLERAIQGVIALRK